MTLGVGIDLVRAARAEQRAIVAAVAYDIVGVEAIVAAGERTGQPVLALVGSSAFRSVDREAIIAAALSLARRSATPVGVHLDHARDLDEIRACLDAGYTSVMVDGSRLDLAGNVALSQRAVGLAAGYGVWVEAELGHLAGDEDRSTGAGAGAMTDPGEVAAFVDDTGIDALAVCVGNVHGRTTGPVELDLGLLAEIASATPVPLVLHGASGVAAAVLGRTIELGVAKLNVNADLRSAYLGAVTAHVAGDPSGDDLPGALTLARAAVTDELVALVGHCVAPCRRGGPGVGR